MPGARRPPSHTALAALPALALDLETTGLDVANDRIVQIGAVAMRGPMVLDEPRIDTRVNPGVPIPASSTRIHGLTDPEVADAPRLAEVIERLAETLSGRVVIGQNIRFDLAVLRHEAARIGVPWRDPPVLDVSHLAGALDRGLVDLGLESLANRFGVTIEARHDAFGDGLAAARIFIALLPRLREADVRTLGEAEAFAVRRPDLVRREVEAAWHSTPGEAPDAPSLPLLVRIDSFLYLRRLDEVMSAPARSITPEVTLRAAARIMALLGAEDHTAADADAPTAFRHGGRDYQYRGAGHTCGTHVMGSAPGNSVVNAWQRTWDHPNLYLAGCGSMPSVGTQNPTLTMLALACRTVDDVLARLA